MRAAWVIVVCVLFAFVAVAQKKPKQAPAKAPKDALVAAADEIARQVAALRGLKLKAPLQKGVLSREEIGAKLKERIAKEYTPEEVRAEARVLKRLGLLPVDADYEKMILDLLMEQVAGFYDPFVGKLFIADWLPLEMQRPALAHEIEHALQDQHFDLKRFASPIKDDGDRQLARSSLVEGDGTALMLEFQAQAMGLPVDQIPTLVAQMSKELLQGSMESTPLFQKAPMFLKETLVFPYLGGLTFIETLRKSQPWTAIDAAWKEPPDSTEQVIHPEKYLKREKPIPVVPAPLPSLPRKELRRDVFGELEWRLWLQTHLDEETATRAAAGWGGDRVVAYSGPGEAPPTVILFSVWDTEGDAREMEVAARKLLAKLAGKPEAAVNAPAQYADANGDLWSVERRGDKLLVACGVPASANPETLASVWKAWKISR